MQSDIVEKVVVSIPVVLAVVSQLAAIFGKPKIVEKITVVSRLVDILSGNYGKSKNRN